MSNLLHHADSSPAPAELLGDLRPLLERIGSAEGLTALAGPAGAPIKRLADLRIFLRHYHSRILRPVELPAIERAFQHASRNEFRELAALDRQLSGEPLLRNFSAASRHIGLAQLQRLRPLRDQRLVQRYLAVVEPGQTNGWHTIVYGLTLAIYSLPLRPGLLGYARLTTRGFIESIGRGLALSEADTDALSREFDLVLPPTAGILAVV